MSDFLLIHGAWHGAWCWQPLIAELGKAGHQARAIDLPGMGEDRTPLAEVTLQGCTERIVRELRSYRSPPILVGHSMGGLFITTAADAVPALVRCTVYLCAFLPQDGESLISLASRPEGATTALHQQTAADGLCTTVEPENARVAFYGRCPESQARTASLRLTPQPLQPVLEPVKLAHADGSSSRAYIECTEDRAITIALQRLMASRAKGIRRYSLATDHSPFLSLPQELTQVLAEIGAG